MCILRDERMRKQLDRIRPLCRILHLQSNEPQKKKGGGGVSSNLLETAGEEILEVRRSICNRELLTECNRLSSSPIVLRLNTPVHLTHTTLWRVDKV